MVKNKHKIRGLLWNKMWQEGNLLLKLFIMTIICFCLISCGGKVEFTREYVTNSDNKGNVTITKLILDDSTISVFEDNFHIIRVIRKTRIDSSFSYQNLYSENWQMDTVFFNKIKKNSIWMKRYEDDLLHRTKKIGKLQLNTWYMFYGIIEKYVHYVFVDSIGHTHVFEDKTKIDNW